VLIEELEMKAIKKFVQILLPLVALVVFSGCAVTQKKEQVRHFYWPQLPERPRVEWIKSYSSQNDFPKTDFELFAQSLTGVVDDMSLLKPVTITSNGEGKVYVVDNDRSALGVHVYDIPRKSVHMLGSSSSFGLFEFPIAVDLDAEGGIYVADINKNSISIFDKDEKPRRSISTKQYIERIGGLAVDKTRKRIMVTDYTGHKLAVFDLDGNLLFSTGKRGAENGEFNFPTGLTVNHKGEIIVADSMNARIQVFAGDGTFLRKFGRRGDGAGDLQIIKGVAVDSDDNIYATDSRANKVVIFSSQGDYLLTVGGMYSALATGRVAPGGFMLPQGIAIDKEDRIYVVDQMNRRFQVFQYISDTYLKTHSIPGYNP
jgi:DNA-binding beta-propeller fold protein YncE